MPDQSSLTEFLAGAFVEASVFSLRPDYRTLLIAADEIRPGRSDDRSEELLQSAEASARRALNEMSVDQLPQVASWRDAYRAFGAKPQRTRNSVEALLRRAAGPGLPRVNRLTDLYNAVSVLHQLPLGGEDLTQYASPPRLIRATGAEPFDTATDGESVVEHPEPGEVVWCDTAGVTCRRWNWRQARRTQLRDDTCTALFILDALDPLTDHQLQAAADDLVDQLAQLGPHLRVSRRLLTNPTPVQET